MLSLPALAREKNLGSFGAWKAYSYVEGGQSVCYMVTTKTIQSSGPKPRTAPYLMITHRPTEASTDVISYGAGAMLDARRGARLHIGQQAFDLFSVRDTAWARDSLTDHKIAATIRTAPVALATGFSAKRGGKPMADRFDLTGAASAYTAIGKACGLIATPRPAAKKAAPPRRAAGH